MTNHHNLKVLVYRIALAVRRRDFSDCFQEGRVENCDGHPGKCACEEQVSEWTEKIIAAVERGGASK